MRISISKIQGPPVEKLPVEIVERKGKGHPDYICDRSVEEASRALSRFYLDKFGSILHHNIDKAVLIGGSSNPRFGGGELIKPIKLLVVGRAVKEARGLEVPVDEIVKDAARGWIGEELRFLDALRHLEVQPEIKPGSAALLDTYQRGRGVPLANDTSFGVGFAPLSGLERIVKDAEMHLNSLELKAELPWVGEDIKVLGLRRGKRVVLTVAAAFISSLVPDLEAYLEHKKRLRALIVERASALSGMPVKVVLNSADDEASGSVYLTVTGTSAEGGDDGQVGRANRVNGLITPYRPMTMEATAGKNPVSHVGKLYNLLANAAAEDISAIEGIEEVYCCLASQIGKPITEPQIVDLKVRTRRRISEVKDLIAAKVQERLSALPDLWKELIFKNIPIF